MAFLVGGANSLTAGYDIDNSLRFNSADSADLRITPSSAGTEETFTISAWIKKSMQGSSNGDDTYLFSSQADSNNRTVMGIWGASGGIFFENKVSGTSSYVAETACRRDTSAWYHCVWAIDTTQGTAANRVKLYVNGTQSTTLENAAGGAADYPDEDIVTQWSRAQVNYVGSRAGGNYYDGYMAEVYYIDGSQLTPSSFGETDEDSGIWKPKKYSGSFGGESWFLEFKGTGTDQDASGIGADTSGEDNHLAVTNLAATDQTTDTPTNNFCTMNPLDAPPSTNHTFSEGNCKVAWSAAAGNFGVVRGTMGVSSGKWYWEVKYTYGNAVQLGVFDVTNLATTLTADVFSNAQSSDFNGLAWRIDTANNIKEVGEGQATDSGVDFSTGDILGIAFDADNGKLYAFDNGTELTGQDIGAGTSLLTAVTVSDFYLPFVNNGDGGSGTKTGTSELNFGNPTFSISSGNSDANGYGNFEYAVPSGYYALCTKNLAEFGG